MFSQIMFQLNSELVPNVLEIFIPFKNLNELHHWYVPFTYINIIKIIINYPSLTKVVRG